MYSENLKSIPYFGILRGILKGGLWYSSYMVQSFQLQLLLPASLPVMPHWQLKQLRAGIFLLILKYKVDFV